MAEPDWLRWTRELQAIAQIGYPLSPSNSASICSARAEVCDAIIVDAKDRSIS